MAEVRKGAVTMKGNPLDLVGPKLKVGDKAPNFTCVSEGMEVVDLAKTSGKARLFSVVPSLDTPVCNAQTRKFDETIASLGDKVAAYTVSTDLPFAMKRFCSEASISNMANLSDAHNYSFGEHYGVLVQSLPVKILARSVFVVGPDDTIKYVQLVPDISDSVDFTAALDALKEAAGA